MGISYDREYYHANKHKWQAYYERTKEEHLPRIKLYRDSHKVERKQWREDNKAATRDYKFKKKYGLSLIEYLQLSSAQDKKCAICKREETATFLGKVKLLAVDHCHKTGKIRGLLCSSCNQGIGLLQDSPEILLSAVAYIRKDEVWKFPKVG